MKVKVIVKVKVKLTDGHVELVAQADKPISALDALHGDNSLSDHLSSVVVHNKSHHSQVWDHNLEG